MKSYAVVQQDDTDSVRTLLACIGATGEIVPAGGRGSVISMARTLATRPDVRVAAILNADTTNDDRVSEQQLIFEDLVTFLGPNSACRLFQAVPTLKDVLAGKGKAIDGSPLAELKNFLAAEPDHQPQNGFGL